MTIPHTQPAGCDLDLDKLEAIARAATRGPWKRSERPNGPFWHISSEFTIDGERCKSGRQAIGALHAENKRGAVKYAAMFEANANFVAAFNPATALDLIAAARAAQAPQGDTRQGAAELAIELVGVRETMAESGGFWSSCSGCHDTEDGHPTGPYSYSSVFGCALGSGCSECGGIGSVWDNTDYEAMSADWDKDDTATPAAHTCTPADELSALLNEIELYFESRANVSEDCDDFYERLAKARAAQGAGTAPALIPIPQVRPVSPENSSWEDVDQVTFDRLKANGTYETRTLYATPPAPVSTAAAPTMQVTAWLATDLDGRGDVGLTKEEAKRRAGEGCTEFIPLYDLPDVATVSTAAPPDETCQRCGGHEVIYVDSTQQPCPTCQDLSDYDEISPTDTSSAPVSTAAATGQGEKA